MSYLTSVDCRNRHLRRPRNTVPPQVKRLPIRIFHPASEYRLPLVIQPSRPTMIGEPPLYDKAPCRWSLAFFFRFLSLFWKLRGSQFVMLRGPSPPPELLSLHARFCASFLLISLVDLDVAPPPPPDLIFGTRVNGVMCCSLEHHVESRRPQLPQLPDADLVCRPEHHRPVFFTNQRVQQQFDLVSLHSHAQNQPSSIPGTFTLSPLSQPDPHPHSARQVPRAHRFEFPYEEHAFPVILFRSDLHISTAIRAADPFSFNRCSFFFASELFLFPPVWCRESIVAVALVNLSPSEPCSFSAAFPLLCGKRSLPRARFSLTGRVPEFFPANLSSPPYPRPKRSHPVLGFDTVSGEPLLSLCPPPPFSPVPLTPFRPPPTPPFHRLVI